MPECPVYLDADPVNRLLIIKMVSDHATRAHHGQFRKDKKTPYIVHPARVAGLVGIFHGSPGAVIAAWLHDVYEDCTPAWIAQTDAFVKRLPLSEQERQEITAIVDSLTKKNTINGKAQRLTDSLERIIDAPPEATLIKLCDRIDNLLDSGDRNGRFTKHYLVSTDEVIDRLSVRASLNGYEDALQTLVTIRNTKIKMK